MNRLLSLAMAFFLCSTVVSCEKYSHDIIPIPVTLSPKVPYWVTDATRESMPSLAAAVFVTRYNNEKNRGEVLLGELKPPFSGWTIPEKAIISGELFVQAAQNIVLEETGLHVNVFGPTTFIQLPYTRPDDSKKVDIMYLVHLAKEVAPSMCDESFVKSGELCEAWQWFDSESVPKKSGSQIVIPSILEYVFKHIQY